LPLDERAAVATPAASRKADPAAATGAAPAAAPAADTTAAAPAAAPAADTTANTRNAGAAPAAAPAAAPPHAPVQPPPIASTNVTVELARVKEAFLKEFVASKLSTEQACAMMRCLSGLEGLVLALSSRNAALQAICDQQPPVVPEVRHVAGCGPQATCWVCVCIPQPAGTFSCFCARAEETTRDVVNRGDEQRPEYFGQRGGRKGEIRKVVANKKFSEVGLEVKQNSAQQPKLVIQDVATDCPGGINGGTFCQQP
ncbi:uncharacterized protein LOC121530444, partial [Drosophila eugracilis]|uniref:uncharacterized protein LOC121530444 n=1 Tax=Drosophila eugracilis TaxID=29029 RepID=UPI001BD9DFA5